MAIEATSAFIGAVIGLMGGVSGIVLGHVLSSTRESRARRIEGLKSVMVEVNRRGRLGLQFDQLVNVGLRTQTPSELAERAFELDGWKSATHELQETGWKFHCMAYLPEAYAEFEEIDRQIGLIMDPEGAGTRAAAASELVLLQAKIQIKVQERLAKLV